MKFCKLSQTDIADETRGFPCIAVLIGIPKVRLPCLDPPWSNVNSTSLGPLLKWAFCYISRLNALFKSQLLTLIRIGLLDINFDVGFNNG